MSKLLIFALVALATIVSGQDTSCVHTVKGQSFDLCRFKKPIEWNTFDDVPYYIKFAILEPNAPSVVPGVTGWMASGILFGTKFSTSGYQPSFELVSKNSIENNRKKTSQYLELNYGSVNVISKETRLRIICDQERPATYSLEEVYLEEGDKKLEDRPVARFVLYSPAGCPKKSSANVTQHNS